MSTPHKACQPQTKHVNPTHCRTQSMSNPHKASQPHIMHDKSSCPTQARVLCRLMCAVMCADAAEAAYAGALNQLSEALTAAVAPLNQLTASLTSQLAVCPYILNMFPAVETTTHIKHSFPFCPVGCIPAVNVHTICTATMLQQLITCQFGVTSRLAMGRQPQSHTLAVMQLQQQLLSCRSGSPLR